MGISKISKVNTLLVSIMIMAVLLCWSTQVQADQDGDYKYTVTDGEAQITDYTGAGGVVVIPGTIGGFPVTSISGYAFFSSKGLTSITIPPGVRNIGYRAFLSCDELTSITVDVNNLNFSSIGGVLFDKAGTTLIECPGGLTSFSIPQGVTSIGPDAFSCCYVLSSVVIPAGVKSIGDGAFYGCSSLTTLNIPQGVTSIGNSAFSYCYRLTGINIPQGVTSIGGSAFCGCAGLTAVTIPPTVTSVGDGAFYDCPGLTAVRFESATTTIEEYEEVDTIPATTKVVGYSPSTAKEYAAKYNRTFEVINNTAASPESTVITVKVNGTPVVFDQPPVIVNDRTLVPLRAIFEALGVQVNWDGDTQTVTATKESTAIVVKIGSTQATVNGETKMLDVPAQIINDRTLVPVRFIAESLGAKVDWDEPSQTVTISE